MLGLYLFVVFNALFLKRHFFIMLGPFVMLHNWRFSIFLHFLFLIIFFIRELPLYFLSNILELSSQLLFEVGIKYLHNILSTWLLGVFLWWLCFLSFVYHLVNCQMLVLGVLVVIITSSSIYFVASLSCHSKSSNISIVAFISGGSVGGLWIERLATICAKVAYMVGFISTLDSFTRMFCIWWEKSSRSERVGIGIVVVANERDVIRDMEAEESGEVVAKEESITITCAIDKVEARWTKISIICGEVATIA